jgi:hypothetical protein
MRISVCLLVIAIAGAFFAYRQKQQAPAQVAEQPPAQVQTASAAPHENSPHDWMKNSLDRTADVKRQVQQQRKESGDAYGR